jgi:hypothetical protein
VSSPAPLSQPVPFRVLLDEAVRQSRRHMKRMYPAVAFPVALAAAAIPVAQGFMMQAVPEAGSPRFPLSIVGFAVVMVVYLLVYYLGYGALFAAAVDALAQRPISMRRAWGLMLRPRILGTLLLLTVAAGLGMMMCLVPGIYLGLLWSLTLPVMVQEGIFGVAALRRSAELTRYNPQRELDADPRFKVFVVIMVGTLIGWVVGMLVQLPMVVIQQVLMLRDVAGGQQPDPARLMAKLMWLQVPSQMIGMLVQTAIHLYICFGLGLLFFDVKGRKEGLDLEAAVAYLVESRFGAAAAAAEGAPASPTAE